MAVVVTESGPERATDRGSLAGLVGLLAGCENQVQVLVGLLAHWAPLKFTERLELTAVGVAVLMTKETYIPGYPASACIRSGVRYIANEEAGG